MARQPKTTSARSILTSTGFKVTTTFLRIMPFHRLPPSYSYWIICWRCKTWSSKNLLPLSVENMTASDITNKMSVNNSVKRTLLKIRRCLASGVGGVGSCCCSTSAIVFPKSVKFYNNEPIKKCTRIG